MTTTRKKYTQELKDEAVGLFLASDLPIAQMVPKVGVKAGTLGSWIKKYLGTNAEKFDTGGHEVVSCFKNLTAHSEVRGRGR